MRTAPSLVLTPGAVAAPPDAVPVQVRSGRPLVRGSAPAALSSVLAVVATLNCLVLLFVPDLLTGPPAMNGSARGTALVALVVAVPLLVASMAAAVRGSARAVPLWLGALAYLLYNGVLFVFATPFDDAFLLSVGTTSLALWSMLALLHALAVPRFGALFAAATRVRPVAWYVGVVVVLNVLLWLKPVLQATFADGPPRFLDGTGVTTNPVYVQDLVFWLPAMGMGAAWLWQRKAWGYVIVAAGLTMWVVEGVGIAADQWLGHAADPSSAVASATATPAFLLVALITAAPLWLLLRGLPARPEPLLGPSPQRRGWAGWSLVGVQSFVGLNAVVGGILMMKDGFGMPADWLAGSGFDSWVLPGLFLVLTVSVPQLGCAATVVAGGRWGAALSMLAGALLVGWIVVQMAVLQRYFFLQPLIAVLGLTEIGLVLAWRRSARSGAGPLETAGAGGSRVS